MGSDELHQHTPERKRDVDDQPILVAAEIEDGPVVAYKIDSAAELPLDLGRLDPLCL